MMSLRMWVAVTLTGAVGCAGGDDPIGTGSGGSSSTSSDTGSGTTVVISGTTDPGTSSSTTDDPGTSSSSTGEGTSSSTGGAESTSTGPSCVPGTEDCPCDGGACDDGLVCTGDDVCETPPNCPQEDSEPNNTAEQAEFIGDFDDFDPNFETADGRLPAASDEDWFSYTCDDNTLGQVDMAYEIDTNIPVRVCQFFACDVPDNPSVVCPDDSEAATSPDGLPGCCSNLPTLTVEDITCNPDSNEDGTIYVRVDMPAQDMCVSYDLGVHC